MEARPPAENRHGGAPRGERPASWDAPRLTSADVAPCKRDNRHVRLSALRPPLDRGGRDHKDTTRAQKRAAGTKQTVLFDIVSSRRAPLRRSHPNVSNRRRLPAAAWPRACRMPRRAPRIAGAGDYPSTLRPVFFLLFTGASPVSCPGRARKRESRQLL
jgi:hypothetical protein